MWKGGSHSHTSWGELACCRQKLASPEKSALVTGKERQRRRLVWTWIAAPFVSWEPALHLLLEAAAPQVERHLAPAEGQSSPPPPPHRMSKKCPNIFVAPRRESSIHSKTKCNWSLLFWWCCLLLLFSSSIEYSLVQRPANFECIFLKIGSAAAAASAPRHPSVQPPETRT